MHTTTIRDPERPGQSAQPRVSVRLHVLTAPGHTPAVLELPLSTLVGRAPQGGLRQVAVQDPRLSRTHCELTPRPDGVEVVDFDSSNGTWVDGLRVERALARHNSVLRVGDVVTVVEVDQGRHVDQAASTADVPGASESARVIRGELRLAARTGLPVLVVGETGTGKERAAQLLHDASSAADPRRTGPLVRLNVAAVPESLFESEIFGHVKGAFTGASAPRAGRLVEADHGTLVLDEIGELPLPLQAKLLRALEEGRARPVGGARDRTVDVRFVATTNADLHALVRAGRFRQDLAARLRGAAVALPPLRERRADLLTLADAVWPAGAPWSTRLSADAVEVLARHAWPDNLRELRAVLARAMTARETPEAARTASVGGGQAGSSPRRVALADLPVALVDAVARLTPGAAASEPPAPASTEPEPPTTARTPPERAALAEVVRPGPKPRTPRPDAPTLRALLATHRGNCGAVARDLGVQRRQVYRWLSYAGIDQAELDAFRA